MRLQDTFVLDNAWRLLLKDLKIDAALLLQHAQLPLDLFAREHARLPTEEYFRLWESLSTCSNDPELPLKIGQMISVEHFTAPIFAALCSPNFTKAVQRLSHFKRLIGPMELRVNEAHDSISITYTFIESDKIVPVALIAAELVFLVRLARLATREEVVPTQVYSTCMFPESQKYERYFGTSIKQGVSNTLLFSRADAERPFLTANEKMWNFFEPELRKNLAALEIDSTTVERVHAALLELLPSGQSSIRAVAKALHTSTRTLQRRLQREGTSFQHVLNGCRKQLAHHYLQNSKMSSTEISFLLGFSESSSFFRAFQTWTGETPEHARMHLQKQHIKST